MKLTDEWIVFSTVKKQITDHHTEQLKQSERFGGILLGFI